MTLVEIKDRVAALVEAAYVSGSEATAAQYETKMAEAVKEAKQEAYRQGHSDALKSLNVEAKTEDEMETSKIPEYDITNDAVAKFMADTSYEKDGFATSDGKSVVTKYTDGNTTEENYIANWPEQPKPVKIGSREYRNLIPGREYNLDGNRFKVVGSVRQIQFTADKPVPNCRDIGGKDGVETAIYGAAGATADGVQAGGIRREHG